jgi:hypothetical protein
MVEMSSGRFKVLNVKSLLRSVYHPGGTPVAQPDADKVRRAAQCVVGAAMASAAVPVFLRPVRLGGPDAGARTTYADGGVRLSLFEASVARAVRYFEDETPSVRGSGRVTLYALRNGPTIVKPAARNRGSSSFQINEKPDALTMALRAYSIIVNQTEVNSIADLRLVHPSGEIRFASADGYDWKARTPCAKDSGAGADDAMFDPQFMRCLIAWGRDKADRFGWTSLDPLPLAAAAGMTEDR